LQGTPKFTQIGIFGLKICHLATLLPGCFLGTKATWATFALSHRLFAKKRKHKQKQKTNFNEFCKHVCLAWLALLPIFCFCKIFQNEKPSSQKDNL
jgi:hypothetical protein